MPFELGRPLGPPNNPAFQLNVLKTLLSLFDDNVELPILHEYLDDAPGERHDPDWQAPVLPKRSGENRLEYLSREIEAMAPLYQQACAKFARTIVGLTMLNIDQIKDYIVGFLDDTWPPSPQADWHPAQALRFASDDLKAYYLEAALSSGGNPSATQLADWFWQDTVGGEILMAVRNSLLARGDEFAVDIGDGAIVPRSRV